MNHYYYIEKNLIKISQELQDKASEVNMAEQSEKSQREIRQSKEYCKLRSLPYLVGEEYVFGHLHMWFVFLLRSEVYKNIPHSIPECPVDCPTIRNLRDLYFEMSPESFAKVAYCILTGIAVKENNVDIVCHFRQLLPKKFVLPLGEKYCEVSKNNNWLVRFEGTLPKNLPRLYCSVEKVLSNRNISESTMKFQVMSLVMRWFNIACVLNWTQDKCNELYHSLEVQKCDMPLLSYWIPQCSKCVSLCETEKWMEKC